jgi:hypothetical protein
MDITTYYVVRLKDGGYGPIRGGLVVFTDHEEAMDQAKREGGGAVVEHRGRKEVNGLAREQGVDYLLIRDKEGGRTVVDVEC